MARSIADHGSRMCGLLDFNTLFLKFDKKTEGGVPATNEDNNYVSGNIMALRPLWVTLCF